MVPQFLHPLKQPRSLGPVDPLTGFSSLLKRFSKVRDLSSGKPSLTASQGIKTTGDQVCERHLALTRYLFVELRPKAAEYRVPWVTSTHHHLVPLILAYDEECEATGMLPLLTRGLPNSSLGGTPEA